MVAWRPQGNWVGCTSLTYEYPDWEVRSTRPGALKREAPRGDVVSERKASVKWRRRRGGKTGRATVSSAGAFASHLDAARVMRFPDELHADTEGSVRAAWPVSGRCGSCDSHQGAGPCEGDGGGGTKEMPAGRRAEECAFAPTVSHVPFSHLETSVDESGAPDTASPIGSASRSVLRLFADCIRNAAATCSVKSTALTNKPSTYAGNHRSEV
ncbi:hypothetical protein EYF80_038340 [Liparis tanakae]|uniref:Uncharacterized protein n=1 Tax=Liparis tanakae TaxID=230148 RepID=A0A4Z2GDZ4_9TELE|nr:hypothetical protein EYF80_038340 [Liparis tanakae]